MLGSLFPAIGANKAAKSQARAANNAAAIQAQSQQQARADLAVGRNSALQELLFGVQNAQRVLNPLVEGGDADLQAYRSELGLGEAPEGYAGFKGTPGYEFIRKEAMRGIDHKHAALNGLNSGALIKEKMARGAGLASLDLGNHLARLGGLAQTGVNARNAMANLKTGFGRDRANIFTNHAAQSANSRIGEGNALADGAIRAGNARAEGTQALFNLPNNLLNENLQVAGTAAEIFKNVAGGASSFVGA